MSDFNKILEHIECNKIIVKLVNGETPKDVSQYLKLKYSKDDEAYLRLPATLLQEFIDKYLDEYKFMNKIILDEKRGTIDKKVAESLLNTKAWRDRIANLADQEIDLKKKIQDMIVRLEARAEQVFDKIQENPGSFKNDYVLIKYFEQLFHALEKADKIINERPDKLIQHDISIHVIEQHSVAFQETIRELLLELDPETSIKFMDLLTNKLSKMNSNNALPEHKTVSERMSDMKDIVDGIIEDSETYLEEDK